MVTESTFIKRRNDQLVGDLQPCYHCTPPITFSTYMEKVDHREKVHGIKRGAADDYKITKGDAHWVDEAANNRLKELITANKVKFQNDAVKKLHMDMLFPPSGENDKE